MKWLEKYRGARFWLNVANNEILNHEPDSFNSRFNAHVAVLTMDEHNAIVEQWQSKLDMALEQWTYHSADETKDGGKLVAIKAIKEGASDKI